MADNLLKQILLLISVSWKPIRLSQPGEQRASLRDSLLHPSKHKLRHSLPSPPPLLLLLLPRFSCLLLLLLSLDGNVYCCPVGPLLVQLAILFVFFFDFLKVFFINILTSCHPV